MKPTLIILAAGMATRYGSMKQTEGFGPKGETIMDYSIYDAIRAGFGKVVFVIRQDFAENFMAIFNPKLQGKIDVEYVYQEMNSFIPEKFQNPDRTKPWGTAHAMLCARDVVKEPFAVINADDFYGTDAFAKAADFLNFECNEKTWAIIGYELRKTLSEHGTVSRGVCDVDADNNLTSITERTKIYNHEGSIVFEENNAITEVSKDTKVSMNFWGFDPNVFDITEKIFTRFLEENRENIKAEFFIPIVADHFIKHEGGTVKMIPTTAQWFGVTYKEDAPAVKKSMDQLIREKAYPAGLWE